MFSCLVVLFCCILYSLSVPNWLWTLSWDKSSDSHDTALYPLIVTVYHAHVKQPIFWQGRLKVNGNLQHAFSDRMWHTILMPISSVSHILSPFSASSPNAHAVVWHQAKKHKGLMYKQCYTVHKKVPRGVRLRVEWRVRPINSILFLKWTKAT